MAGSPRDASLTWLEREEGLDRGWYAGAVGYVSHEAIGSYRYPKILDDGRIMPCIVRVYPMIVEKLKRRWKEKGQRKRHWFSPKDAAKRVAEEDLAALLMTLHKKPLNEKPVRELLKAS